MPSSKKVPPGKLAYVKTRKLKDGTTLRLYFYNKPTPKERKSLRDRIRTGSVNTTQQ